MAAQHTLRVRSLRWYDRYPNIRQIIGISKDLPRPIQERIGECLLLIAEEYWLMQDKSFKIKSLKKPNLIIALYKSQNNHRWYDSIPEMQGAINLMMMLPEFAMRQIDDRCSTLLESVQFERANLMLCPEGLTQDTFSEMVSHLESYSQDIVATSA